MMVLLLTADIVTDHFLIAFCISETCITISPASEMREPFWMSLQPLGRFAFQHLHKFTYRYVMTNAHKDMNMIGHRVDTMQHTLLLLTDAQYIGIQVTFMLLVDCGFGAFCSPYNMIYE